MKTEKKKTFRKNKNQKWIAWIAKLRKYLVCIMNFDMRI